MRISILGGTGDIGEGLALRWGRDTDHEIVIGSREADRAVTAATRYAGQLQARGYDPTITGDGNEAAVRGADVVVASVPPYSVADAIEQLGESIPEDAIIVTPAVGIKRDDDGVHYHRPSVGSVTRLAADAASESVSVVGAFHSVPAQRLADLDDPLDMDTIVIGDDTDARTTILGLANEIEGLTALNGGPIANAPEVESLTALLINLGRYNESLHEAGIRVVSPDRPAYDS